ncbi:hypothetical protein [Lyngbya confervoides]|uniref:Uncharacterized protein n=1 Tax=Lyngbya confervoides BDU141951 TaxID=1574623 RepID=A0ABD4T1B4_9CYAN|nr:hypothetical protein [Lyngbya confervoides]MCM1982502.1 hypothetical protein [Lyngbya confervoides BDU141951]
MAEPTVNCAVECVNGCVLGDDCPHQAYREAASKFIQNTSIDRMVEIAEESLHKRLTRSIQGDNLPDLPPWPDA